ncbi:unnamed protein product [Rhizoctonia solani]|uniref:Uncharacterized protein n=1 Tax=Rhizoctonia solani TaxID=456999 RepID=A0A8H3AIX6_9AGAM|nr:unnamed protein product [Rhizoctonia solani]
MAHSNVESSLGMTYQSEDGQTVVFKDEEAHYNSYEAAITAAVNWVTNEKFELGKHEKRVPLHRKFKEKMVLYPSKGTPSIPKDDICGVAEQSTSKVDFVRLDRNEQGVHFNAKYVGKNESVPSSAKKAAVFIDHATDAQFKAWVKKLKETTSVTDLWDDSWYVGKQP